MKTLVLLLASVLLIAGSTAKAQDQKRDRIHQEDHLRLQDGSCLLVKDGVPTQLQTQYKLDNGTVINPDGSYQLQNQQRYQLRNGECLDMKGNRYLNQNQFNRRVMMTNKQIERVKTRATNQGRQVNRAGQRKGAN